MFDFKVLRDNPEIAKNVRLEISGSDLLEFSDAVVARAIEAGKLQNVTAPEEYLTSDEMAKTLKISEVTLWSWDRKGITEPLRIGNQKRYRRSDVEKFLNRK